MRKRTYKPPPKIFSEFKAVCTGCERTDKDVEEYTDDDPVTDDGTYANGNFVCTECYMELIDVGCDVGEPEELQRRAARLLQDRARRTETGI